MRYVWITTQRENFHKWDLAPVHVAYLASSHRHIFKFKVWIEVHHDDREIEFITFKHDVEDTLDTCGWSNMSCEMIADWLHSQLRYLKSNYCDRKMKIEVSEDGENGCLCTYGDEK